MKICKLCSGTDINSLGKCRPCWAAYMREYNIKHPEKMKQRNKDYKLNKPRNYKNSQLKVSFNITIEQYENLLHKQNFMCAICNKAESVIDNRTKKVRNLAVDHCHETNQIRGLLCQKCNQALGLLGDNIVNFTSAIKYLSER